MPSGFSLLLRSVCQGHGGGTAGALPCSACAQVLGSRRTCQSRVGVGSKWPKTHLWLRCHRCFAQLRSGGTTFSWRGPLLCLAEAAEVTPSVTSHIPGYEDPQPWLLGHCPKWGKGREFRMAGSSRMGSLTAQPPPEPFLALDLCCSSKPVWASQMHMSECKSFQGGFFHTVACLASHACETAVTR